MPCFLLIEESALLTKGVLNERKITDEGIFPIRGTPMQEMLALWLNYDE